MLIKNLVYVLCQWFNQFSYRVIGLVNQFVSNHSIDNASQRERSAKRLCYQEELRFVAKAKWIRALTAVSLSHRTANEFANYAQDFSRVIFHPLIDSFVESLFHENASESNVKSSVLLSAMQNSAGQTHMTNFCQLISWSLHAPMQPRGGLDFGGIANIWFFKGADENFHSNFAFQVSGDISRMSVPRALPVKTLANSFKISEIFRLRIWHAKAGATKLRGIELLISSLYWDKTNALTCMLKRVGSLGERRRKKYRNVWFCFSFQAVFNARNGIYFIYEFIFNSLLARALLSD